MKVVIEVDVVDVLIVSNREGGNRILIRRRRARVRRQIFIGPVCAVKEELMQMEGAAPEVVDMLLIVGRSQNGRDLGENVRLDSTEALVYPRGAVVGKLMKVLPISGQHGE